MVRKIYLDVDEEITSVIDRLKSAEEADLNLVVPKESSLLQSVVNLKLLKREADKLNKNISIVTSSKVGRTLAENVGLSVEGGKVAEPKEEQLIEPTSEGKDSVLIEYREEAKEKEEPETIAFKKGKIKDGDDEISIKEEEEKEESKPEENGDKEEPKEEKPVFQNQKTKKKFKLNGFALALFLTFIGLFIFAYIYIPRATVNIKILAEKKAFETDITVDKKEPDSKIDRALLNGDLIELEKDFQKKFKSTGKKEIGTKATGTIIVSNKYDSNTQTLVAGTRFASPSGLIFKTTQQVSVPGASVSGGSLQAGSTSVNVEAENPGNQYNIQGSHFTIPSFSGTAKDGLIYGDSNQSMSGGESRQANVVSQSDYNTAKESYKKDAEDEAKKALKEKAKKDYSLPDEAMEIKLGEFEASPNVGQEGEEFTLKIKISAKGLAYKEREMKEAYSQKLKDEAGSSREVVEDGFDKKKITISKPDFENGSLSLNIKSDVYFGTAIDKKSLFTELSGQNEKKSLEYLSKLEGVKEARIDFWPSFLKRMPRMEKHVKIKTEATQKETEEEKND